MNKRPANKPKTTIKSNITTEGPDKPAGEPETPVADPAARSDDPYTSVAWRRKSAAEQQQIANAWGALIIAKMDVETIYGGLSAAQWSALERRAAERVLLTMQEMPEPRRREVAVAIRLARKVLDHIDNGRKTAPVASTEPPAASTPAPPAMPAASPAPNLTANDPGEMPDFLQRKRADDGVQP